MTEIFTKKDRQNILFVLNDLVKNDDPSYSIEDKPKMLKVNLYQGYLMSFNFQTGTNRFSYLVDLNKGTYITIDKVGMNLTDRTFKLFKDLYNETLSPEQRQLKQKIIQKEQEQQKIITQKKSAKIVKKVDKEQQEQTIVN